MLPTYIPDGYTTEGYIAEEPGLHGPISFEYRVPINPEIAGFFGEARKFQKDDAAERHSAKFIAEHLVSWDVVAPLKSGDEPSEIPINANSVARIDRHAFRRMLATITRAEPSDQKPGAPAPAADHDAAEKN